LLRLFDYSIGVQRPGQVVRYRHSGEFDALHSLDLRSVDEDRRVLPSGLPEVNDQLVIRFASVEGEIVVVAVVGDFNFPNIDLDSHIFRSLDGEKVVEFFQEKFPIQHVNGQNRGGAKHNGL